MKNTHKSETVSKTSKKLLRKNQLKLAEIRKMKYLMQVKEL